jgi:acylglycerol lipase
VRVLVTQPGAARQPPRRLRLCLAVPGPASEIAAAAEEEAEQEVYLRTSAVEMDAAVRRELAIRRLREDAEAEAGTGRSRRDFAVFETTRGDVLFTQSWTPAAADRVKYAHLPTPVH